MSHCTKFDFTYSDEPTIVRAFARLGTKYETNMVCEFKSEFAKHVLSAINPFGSKQYRAIIGELDGYNLFVCRVKPNHYELFVESEDFDKLQSPKVGEIEKRFRMAYMGASIDKVVRKLDNSGMPSSVEVKDNGYLVTFGPAGEYTLSLVFDNGRMTEEVTGIKGDFCTKLTEDIENVLSHPEAELATEWTQEATMMVDDQNIQVLSLQF